uniref:Translation initiation factor IF-3 n=1 Tax=Candidatus Kentrum sp. DK TaxID=2126562 RepID=A0A450SGN2_9GAMM|nr:MAG: bacterial translation initiation factor 3 (bIF-3) [Candidatus Kentron sp. DK]VFJ52180.1 MAG: bacterial translation initiation factor 3 (bIF-3) [Candidatus Kentron sp. DK]
MKEKRQAAITISNRRARGIIGEKRFRETEKKNRVNQEIRVPEIRLVGADGEQIGVVAREEGLALAEQAELDLVEIAPFADPPVCRIMDYGKFLFQQNKKRQAAKKKQQQTQLKEVKFRPGTEEGDYQTKLRNIKKFLEQGNKTKVTLWFRGREMAHQDLGARLLKRVEADMEEIAKVEHMPRLEGRRLFMVLSPR